MKYLIACDLDGSLLNKKSELTKKTIKTLNDVRKLGHIVVLATGRPFGGAIGKYDQIGLDTPLITDNGGSIENPKDPAFPKQKTFIPLHMMHELFTFCKPFLESAFFSDDQAVYAYRHSTHLEGYFSGTLAEKVIEAEFTDLNVEPTGLVFLIKSENGKDLESYLDRECCRTLSYRLWGSDQGFSVYEIYLRRISKSSAIKYLLDYYDMNYDQVISFGDGYNDIEMIRDARLGVAMLNGVDDLKKVARDITTYDHDHDGIAHYLIDYFKLKK